MSRLHLLFCESLKEGGSTDLLTQEGLADAYHRYCQSEIEPSMAALVPTIPDNDVVPLPASSLKALIDQPPIGGRSIEPLSADAIRRAFTLKPGSTPNVYLTQAEPIRRAEQEKVTRRLAREEAVMAAAEMKAKGATVSVTHIGPTRTLTETVTSSKSRKKKREGDGAGGNAPKRAKK